MPSSSVMSAERERKGRFFSGSSERYSQCFTSQEILLLNHEAFECAKALVFKRFCKHEGLQRNFLVSTAVFDKTLPSKCHKAGSKGDKQRPQKEDACTQEMDQSYSEWRVPLVTHGCEREKLGDDTAEEVDGAKTTPTEWPGSRERTKRKSTNLHRQPTRTDETAETLQVLEKGQAHTLPELHECFRVGEAHFPRVIYAAYAPQAEAHNNGSHIMSLNDGARVPLPDTLAANRHISARTTVRTRRTASCRVAVVAGVTCESTPAFATDSDQYRACAAVRIASDLPKPQPVNKMSIHACGTGGGDSCTVEADTQTNVPNCASLPSRKTSEQDDDAMGIAKALLETVRPGHSEVTAQTREETSQHRLVDTVNDHQLRCSGVSHDLYNTPESRHCDDRENGTTASGRTQSEEKESAHEPSVHKKGESRTRFDRPRFSLDDTPDSIKLIRWEWPVYSLSSETLLSDTVQGAPLQVTAGVPGKAIHNSQGEKQCYSLEHQLLAALTAPVSSAVDLVDVNEVSFPLLHIWHSSPMLELRTRQVAKISKEFPGVSEQATRPVVLAHVAGDIICTDFMPFFHAFNLPSPHFEDSSRVQQVPSFRRSQQEVSSKDFRVTPAASAVSSSSSSLQCEQGCAEDLNVHEKKVDNLVDPRCSGQCFRGNPATASSTDILHQLRRHCGSLPLANRSTSANIRYSQIPRQSRRRSRTLWLLGDAQTSPASCVVDLMLPKILGVPGSVRMEPNCCFHLVRVNGWPHIFLCSIPGVALQANSLLLADRFSILPLAHQQKYIRAARYALRSTYIRLLREVALNPFYGPEGNERGESSSSPSDAAALASSLAARGEEKENQYRFPTVDHEEKSEAVVSGAVSVQTNLLINYSVTSGSTGDSETNVPLGDAEAAGDVEAGENTTFNASEVTRESGDASQGFPSGATGASKVDVVSRMAFENCAPSGVCAVGPNERHSEEAICSQSRAPDALKQSAQLLVRTTSSGSIASTTEGYIEPKQLHTTEDEEFGKTDVSNVSQVLPLEDLFKAQDQACFLEARNNYFVRMFHSEGQLSLSCAPSASFQTCSLPAGKLIPRKAESMSIAFRGEGNDRLSTNLKEEKYRQRYYSFKTIPQCCSSEGLAETTAASASDLLQQAFQSRRESALDTQLDKANSPSPKPNFRSVGSQICQKAWIFPVGQQGSDSSIVEHSSLIHSSCCSRMQQRKPHSDASAPEVQPPNTESKPSVWTTKIAIKEFSAHRRSEPKSPSTGDTGNAFFQNKDTDPSSEIGSGGARSCDRDSPSRAGRKKNFTHRDSTCTSYGLTGKSAWKRPCSSVYQRQRQAELMQAQQQRGPAREDRCEICRRMQCPLCMGIEAEITSAIFCVRGCFKDEERQQQSIPHSSVVCADDRCHTLQSHRLSMEAPCELVVRDAANAENIRSVYTSSETYFKDNGDNVWAEARNVRAAADTEKLRDIEVRLGLSTEQTAQFTNSGMEQGISRTGALSGGTAVSTVKGSFQRSQSPSTFQVQQKGDICATRHSSSNEETSLQQAHSPADVVINENEEARREKIAGKDVLVEGNVDSFKRKESGSVKGFSARYRFPSKVPISPTHTSGGVHSEFEIGLLRQPPGGWQGDHHWNTYLEDRTTGETGLLQASDMFRENRTSDGRIVGSDRRAYSTGRIDILRQGVHLCTAQVVRFPHAVELQHNVGTCHCESASRETTVTNGNNHSHSSTSSSTDGNFHQHVEAMDEGEGFCERTTPGACELGCKHKPLPGSGTSHAVETGSEHGTSPRRRVYNGKFSFENGCLHEEAKEKFQVKHFILKGNNVSTGNFQGHQSEKRLPGTDDNCSCGEDSCADKCVLPFIAASSSISAPEKTSSDVVCDVSKRGSPQFVGDRNVTSHRVHVNCEARPETSVNEGLGTSLTLQRERNRLEPGSLNSKSHSAGGQQKERGIAERVKNTGGGNCSTSVPCHSETFTCAQTHTTYPVEDGKTFQAHPTKSAAVGAGSELCNFPACWSSRPKTLYSETREKFELNHSSACGSLGSQSIEGKIRQRYSADPKPSEANPNSGTSGIHPHVSRGQEDPFEKQLIASSSVQSQRVSQQQANLFAPKRFPLQINYPAFSKDTAATYKGQAKQQGQQATRVPLNYSPKQSRTCAVLTCDYCGRRFHLCCLKLPACFSPPSANEWICYMCVNKVKRILRSRGGTFDLQVCPVSGETLPETHKVGPSTKALNTFLRSVGVPSQHVHPAMLESEGSEQDETCEWTVKVMPKTHVSAAAAKELLRYGVACQIPPPRSPAPGLATPLILGGSEYGDITSSCTSSKWARVAASDTAKNSIGKAGRPAQIRSVPDGGVKSHLSSDAHTKSPSTSYAVNDESSPTHPGSTCTNRVNDNVSLPFLPSEGNPSTRLRLQPCARCFAFCRPLGISISETGLRCRLQSQHFQQPKCDVLLGSSLPEAFLRAAAVSASALLLLKPYAAPKSWEQFALAERGQPGRALLNCPDKISSTENSGDCCDYCPNNRKSTPEHNYADGDNSSNCYSGTGSSSSTSTVDNRIHGNVNARNYEKGDSNTCGNGKADGKSISIAQSVSRRLIPNMKGEYAVAFAQRVQGIGHRVPSSSAKELASTVDQQILAAACSRQRADIHPIRSHACGRSRSLLKENIEALFAELVATVRGNLILEELLHQHVPNAVDIGIKAALDYGHIEGELYEHRNFIRNVSDPDFHINAQAPLRDTLHASANATNENGQRDIELDFHSTAALTVPESMSTWQSTRDHKHASATSKEFHAVNDDKHLYLPRALRRGLLPKPLESFRGITEGAVPTGTSTATHHLQRGSACRDTSKDKEWGLNVCLQNCSVNEQTEDAAPLAHVLVQRNAADEAVDAQVCAEQCTVAKIAENRGSKRVHKEKRISDLPESHFLLRPGTNKLTAQDALHEETVSNICNDSNEAAYFVNYTAPQQQEIAISRSPRYSGRRSSSSNARSKRRNSISVPGSGGSSNRRTDFRKAVGAQSTSRGTARLHSNVIAWKGSAVEPKEEARVKQRSGSRVKSETLLWKAGRRAPAGARTRSDRQQHLRKQGKTQVAAPVRTTTRKSKKRVGRGGTQRDPEDSGEKGERREISYIRSRRFPTSAADARKGQHRVANKDANLHCEGRNPKRKRAVDVRTSQHLEQKNLCVTSTTVSTVDASPTAVAVLRSRADTGIDAHGREPPRCTAASARERWTEKKGRTKRLTAATSPAAHGLNVTASVRAAAAAAPPAVVVPAASPSPDAAAVLKNERMGHVVSPRHAQAEAARIEQQKNLFLTAEAKSLRPWKKEISWSKTHGHWVVTPLQRFSAAKFFVPRSVDEVAATLAAACEFLEQQTAKKEKRRTAEAVATAAANVPLPLPAAAPRDRPSATKAATIPDFLMTAALAGASRAPAEAAAAAAAFSTVAFSPAEPVTADVLTAAGAGPTAATVTTPATVQCVDDAAIRIAVIKSPALTHTPCIQAIPPTFDVSEIPLAAATSETTLPSAVAVDASALPSAVTVASADASSPLVTAVPADIALLAGGGYAAVAAASADSMGADSSSATSVAAQISSPETSPAALSGSVLIDVPTQMASCLRGDTADATSTVAANCSSVQQYICAAATGTLLQSAAAGVAPQESHAITSAVAAAAASPLSIVIVTSDGLTAAAENAPFADVADPVARDASQPNTGAASEAAAAEPTLAPCSNGVTDPHIFSLDDPCNSSNGTPPAKCVSSPAIRGKHIERAGQEQHDICNTRGAEQQATRKTQKVEEENTRYREALEMQGNAGERRSNESDCQTDKDHSEANAQFGEILTAKPTTNDASRGSGAESTPRTGQSSEGAQHSTNEAIQGEQLVHQTDGARREVRRATNRVNCMKDVRTSSIRDKIEESHEAVKDIVTHTDCQRRQESIDTRIFSVVARSTLARQSPERLSQMESFFVGFPQEVAAGTARGSPTANDLRSHLETAQILRKSAAIAASPSAADFCCMSSGKTGYAGKSDKVSPSVQVSVGNCLPVDKAQLQKRISSSFSPPWRAKGGSALLAAENFPDSLEGGRQFNTKKGSTETRCGSLLPTEAEQELETKRVSLALVSECLLQLKHKSVLRPLPKEGNLCIAELDLFAESLKPYLFPMTYWLKGQRAFIVKRYKYDLVPAKKTRASTRLYHATGDSNTAVADLPGIACTAADASDNAVAGVGLQAVSLCGYNFERKITSAAARGATDSCWAAAPMIPVTASAVNAAAGATSVASHGSGPNSFLLPIAAEPAPEQQRLVTRELEDGERKGDREKERALYIHSHAGPQSATEKVKNTFPPVVPACTYTSSPCLYFIKNKKYVGSRRFTLHENTRGGLFAAYENACCYARALGFPLTSMLVRQKAATTSVKCRTKREGTENKVQGEAVQHREGDIHKDADDGEGNRERENGSTGIKETKHKGEVCTSERSDKFSLMRSNAVSKPSHNGKTPVYALEQLDSVGTEVSAVRPRHAPSTPCVAPSSSSRITPGVSSSLDPLPRSSVSASSIAAPASSPSGRCTLYITAPSSPCAIACTKSPKEASSRVGTRREKEELSMDETDAQRSGKSTEARTHLSATQKSTGMLSFVEPCDDSSAKPWEGIRDNSAEKQKKVERTHGTAEDFTESKDTEETSLACVKSSSVRVEAPGCVYHSLKKEQQLQDDGQQPEKPLQLLFSKHSTTRNQSQKGVASNSPLQISAVSDGSSRKRTKFSRRRKSTMHASDETPHRRRSPRLVEKPEERKASSFNSHLRVRRTLFGRADLSEQHILSLRDSTTECTAGEECSARGAALTCTKLLSENGQPEPSQPPAVQTRDFGCNARSPDKKTNSPDSSGHADDTYAKEKQSVKAQGTKYIEDNAALLEQRRTAAVCALSGYSRNNETECTLVDDNARVPTAAPAAPATRSVNRCPCNLSERVIISAAADTFHFNDDILVNSCRQTEENNLSGVNRVSVRQQQQDDASEQSVAFSSRTRVLGSTECANSINEDISSPFNSTWRSRTSHGGDGRLHKERSNSDNQMDYNGESPSQHNNTTNTKCSSLESNSRPKCRSNNSGGSRCNHCIADYATPASRGSNRTSSCRCTEEKYGCQHLFAESHQQCVFTPGSIFQDLQSSTNGKAGPYEKGKALFTMDITAGWRSSDRKQPSLDVPRSSAISLNKHTAVLSMADSCSNPQQLIVRDKESSCGAGYLSETKREHRCSVVSHSSIPLSEHPSSSSSASYQSFSPLSAPGSGPQLPFLQSVVIKSYLKRPRSQECHEKSNFPLAGSCAACPKKKICMSGTFGGKACSPSCTEKSQVTSETAFHEAELQAGHRACASRRESPCENPHSRQRHFVPRTEKRKGDVFLCRPRETLFDLSRRPPGERSMRRNTQHTSTFVNHSNRMFCTSAPPSHGCTSRDCYPRITRRSCTFSSRSSCFTPRRSSSRSRRTSNCNLSSSLHLSGESRKRSGCGTCGVNGGMRSNENSSTHPWSSYNTSTLRSKVWSSCDSGYFRENRGNLRLSKLRCLVELASPQSTSSQPLCNRGFT